MFERYSEKPVCIVFVSLGGQYSCYWKQQYIRQIQWSTAGIFCLANQRNKLYIGVGDNFDRVRRHAIPAGMDPCPDSGPAMRYITPRGKSLGITIGDHNDRLAELRLRRQFQCCSCWSRLWNWSMGETTLKFLMAAERHCVAQRFAERSKWPDDLTGWQILQREECKRSDNID